MIVRLNQNGMEKDIRLDGIREEPKDIRLGCTALEYGNALAAALKDHMEESTEAEVDVLSDAGVSIHKLRFVLTGRGLSVTDRGEGACRPTVGFQQRTERIPDRYLVRVDAEENLNEFYKMTDLGGGEWGATYGRIGEQQGRRRAARNVVVPKSYPDYMFGLKLMEKLKKGYQDKSSCHSVKVMKRKKPDSSTEGISSQQVAQLIEALMSYAQLAIQANYTVSYTDVTEEMIRQAKQAIDSMRGSGSTAQFNHYLLELMHIIPRKIDGRGDLGVKRLLAKNSKDYAGILVREAELLDIMEGQIGAITGSMETEKNMLERMGLEINEATHDQEQEVRAQLNHSLKPRLRRVFCVANHRTQKQFDQYLDGHRDHLGNTPKVRLFWHGSRNANWFSILQKGLLLNPDAVITGKMFGQGVYFAPSAMKSWGYTSGNGAVWTKGSSNTAFMALYATAYGNPYVVYDYSGNWNGYNYRRLQSEHNGCSCVHAKSDRGMLRNDEVIFYREDQVTIRYICEFAA